MKPTQITKSKRRTQKLLGSLTAAAMSLGVSSTSLHAEEASYILATASTGGTYYPVGVALATLTKVKLQPSENISMSAISSAGSGENIRLLREDEAQFAILQGLYGYYAKSGTGPLGSEGPQENLRSVTMLWQNVEHFVLNNDYVESGTMADFIAQTGETMALGSRNSGTLGSNTAILDGFDVNVEEDYDLIYAGYGPSAEAVQNGQAAGMSTPAGVPVGAVSQLMASVGDSVTLLSFTEEEAAKADNGRDLWTLYTIPAGTYSGIDEDVQTIAQPNFLATTDDVSEENVYMITKTIYENLPFLQSIHPATKAMAIEKAIAGLPLPLHPGAQRYYEEVGIEVPERLVAK